MRVFLIPAVLFLGVVFTVVASPSSCEPFPSARPETGAHGYRTWYSTVLMSSITAGERVCVPSGWMAVGAQAEGADWAEFLPGQTAVMIRTDAFASTTLTFSDSAYTVSLLIPTEIENPGAYEAMVRHAFERIGAFYDHEEAIAHTVVVTAALGFIHTEEGSIYPDPNERVSYLILPPENPRGEELFIHAVGHLYNRFSYPLPEQPPLSSTDIQELEASWLELALLPSNERRHARFSTLYELHHAYPEPMPPYREVEYDHYILGPLVMVAIEGLLEIYGADVTVADLFATLHNQPEQMFFTLLETHLPADAVETVNRWLFENEKIPHALLRTGLSQYER
ncbi:hypothetical protein K2Y00_03645 [Patescibacteria group bacterium]|nr:hypothetical protein [Patescibacteria group bacterium]